MVEENKVEEGNHQQSADQDKSNQQPTNTNSINRPIPQQGNFFDSMMFGQRSNRPPSTESKQTTENSKEESFDIMNTAQTMMETYNQLSPYVKGVSNMVKKFKK
ncbi:hypothetical protein GH741_11875 [Aquibacillus halophilus]|uniref:Uncharacterized protein n=1 Tax=Aquibacillus halophilus TaxID=930132 RepID=A0A6A8DK65_9BACI|nr:hypothetical protein [Aquibacillus halophilus]MRH43377.1 hypothetical protein [Aquibacillus halophilus]